MEIIGIKFNEPQDREITGTIETLSGWSKFRVFKSFYSVSFHQSGETQEAMYEALPAIETIQNNFEMYYSVLTGLFTAK